MQQTGMATDTATESLAGRWQALQQAQAILGPGCAGESQVDHPLVV
mgnify:CR=1 FL=1